MVIYIYIYIKLKIFVFYIFYITMKYANKLRLFNLQLNVHTY